ncbi:hypothetical protein [Lutibacter flavus]|uniref:Uncharacterized protein n=1 Tax=Lutibacter flavus TaxID=691689 RepID=A0A238YYU7_9FLAO|nr:hypothetical protein [Lutibacter flavus]SNR75699.1 hypothetical protein SAMN04488111_2901 [Lutibacter flavus]
MKAKHLLNISYPLSKQSYDALRKGLKLGELKWINFPKELKDAFHNFEQEEREIDFEKRLHKESTNEFDSSI